MLTLSLLRHAKSSWDDLSLDDHDRPLNKRGMQAAETMGAYLAERKDKPDGILCSDSVRTRQTLKRILPHLGTPSPKVVIDPELYLAPATLMLAQLRKTSAGFQHVMMIGHNPGMQALALDLAGSGSKRDIATMAIKFPTCGLAVLTFETQTWSEVRPTAGRLTAFVTPRSLS